MKAQRMPRLFMFTCLASSLFFHAIECSAAKKLAPKPRWWLERVVVTVLMPQDLYWSMDVLDLADVSAELAAAYPDRPVTVGPQLRDRLSSYHADLAENLATYLSTRPDLDPEVRQALLYRSFPEEMDATVEWAESELYYRTRAPH